MYRRCNFNVTFSKQKLLDINIKAVWLNGLYCELVDLADVDIIKLYLHLPIISTSAKCPADTWITPL